MAKKLVFMRAHFLEPYILSEYEKLRASMNYEDECVLFVDNTNNLLPKNTDSPVAVVRINGIKIKCFLYDETVLEEMNLPKQTDDINNSKTGKILWYNGDYAFYCIRKYFPDYDYYWCSEYDVFCNGNSYKPFFNTYENDDSDLISTHFRPIDFNNKEWIWSDNAEWVYSNNEHYRCFLPVVRLSAKAVDFLYERRKEHGEIFKNHADDKNVRWIFCELFVATELMKNEYKCSLMQGQFLRYSPVFNLNTDRFFEYPNFRLYHPVR